MRNLPVRHRCRPFTHHEPVRGVSSVRRGVVADQLAMLPRLQGNLIVCKDLVLVVIDHDAAHLLRRRKVVPEAAVLKGVVDHDRRVPQIPHRIVSFVVIVRHALHAVWQCRGKRFVEQLDGDDDVFVRWHRILVADGFEDVERLSDGVAISPAGFGDAMARIVEAVLGAGGAVQVDPDFEADLAGPLDALVEEWRRAWDVGLVIGKFVGPVYEFFAC